MSNQQNQQKTYRGSCLCGAIEFSLKGQATIVHSCHCGMCRKHNGVPSQCMHCTDFIVHKGSEFLTEHASSEWANRSFCNQCGSGIMYRTNDESFYGVSLGVLDNPEPPMEKPKLAQHIYVDCAELCDDLTPDIWDDLPRMKGQEFLRSIGLEHLFDHHQPATSPPDTAEHHGGCSCGGVRFNTTMLPDAPVICHCGQCRKQTGSYLRTVAVDLAHLIFTQQDTLKWYHASTKARRGFCQDCGSKLFWQPLKFREREYMSILSGVFDARIPQIPAQHIFTEDAEHTYPLAP